MERLTFEGNFCDIAMRTEIPCLYDNACSQRKVWERLKRYEDAGLEPEEAEQRERAIYEAALQTYGTNTRTIKPQGEWIDMYGGKYDNPRYACSLCGGKALYKIERNTISMLKN